MTDFNKIIDDIKSDISIYEADCKLSSDDSVCIRCCDNIFGSIYRIIDKHTGRKEHYDKRRICP